jgi:hypothetical protein
MESGMDTKTRRRKRSFFFWGLLLGFAFLSLSGWSRLFGSINSWYWLTLANISPGPLYLAVTGAVWGIIGLAALLWIGLRRPGYPQAGTIAALLFALTYWADRLLFRQTEASVPNLLFSMLFTLFCLLYVLLILKPVDSLVPNRITIFSKSARNFGKDRGTHKTEKAQD